MKTLIFDTETSGLVENRIIRDERLPEVIEFYGCVCDLSKKEVLDEYECLIKPKRLPLEEKIEKITGITSAQLADKLPFIDHASEIDKLITSADRVIAHNLSFDMEMMDIEFGRYDHVPTWPSIKVCTVEQTVHLRGYRMNLGDLYEMMLGKRFDGAHRARVDVLALMEVAHELEKQELI